MSYEALLNTPLEDIQPPQPLPEGHYRATINKLAKRTIKTKDGQELDLMRMSFKLFAAAEDVEHDLLPEDWRERQLHYDYWMTKNDIWKLHDFATKTMKLELPEGGTLRDAILQLMDAEVLIHIAVRLDDNNEPRYNDVKKIMNPAAG